MDELALERAKQRLADRAAKRSEPADFEATLERSRGQVEALAATTAELQAAIPVEIEAAVRDAIRTEVLPVGRHIAEIHGLLNQVIRRLERIEGELLAERHARVDDLGLLVDLVSSAWRGVDARLAALENREVSTAPIDLPPPVEAAEAPTAQALPTQAVSAQAVPAQAEHAEALAERAEAA
jgi:hypothetical protein